MDEAEAKELVDKIMGQVFGFQNPLTLDQVMQKFAFDIRLPQQVFDMVSNQPTWAQSTGAPKFMTFQSMLDAPDGNWLRPKRPLNGIEDMLAAWSEINEMATERQLDSLNVGQSDNIYSSENIFRSMDIHDSKNIVFSDGVMDGCEYVLASQRAQASTFCIRLEDSSKCSNSFNVQWSNSISNSLFISNATKLQDCMFCSNINSQQYMIANMQFTKEEYMQYREMVVRWILTG